MRLISILFTALVCAQSFASVSVSVNGTSYTIPQTNEKGWGTNVTSWIQAMSLYTLQPSGGTFTLTAEVDTGATYGFKVPYIKTQTSTPATAGVLRLAKSDVIDWRNNGGGGNNVLGVDSSDNLTWNSVIIPSATSASVQDSTFTIYDNGDNTKKIAFQASGVSAGTTRTITAPDFNVDLGNLTVAQGGTGRNSLTNHGVLVGATTSAITQLAAGSAGQILQSGGASADPAYSTPTYPSSSGSTGTILRSDGTNNVYTTNTFPNTAVAGSILNASSANVLAATVTPTLGVAGTSAGTLGLSGVTSGVVTLKTADAAGTWSLVLPITHGSSGQVLTASGSDSTATTWSSPLVSPFTTKGDLITNADGSTAVRLGAGSNYQVLTANSAATNGIDYETVSSSSEIRNCSIAASVGSNILTVALKDNAGSDPSATSLCKIGFRNATATTGTYTEVAVSAATSVAASNGSQIGCPTASVSCVIYVYAINNAGTVELGLVGLSQLDEGTVQSSTAEGAAGGADAANTLYSTTSRASKAVRLLGRLTITPGASFAWTAGPTEISNIPFVSPSITSWVSFTPTGAWSSNSTYTGFWRRVGDTMEVQVKIALGGAPTSASLTVNIPAGYTIDTTKIISGADGFTQVGFGTARDAGVDSYPFYLRYTGSTTAVAAMVIATAGTNANSAALTQAVPFAFGNGDSVEMKFSIPIVGW